MIARRWRRAGRAGLELLRDALFPSAALARAARHAVYLRIEPLAAGRRVLDLCGGRGRGALHLHSAGAAEVVVMASPGRLRRLARPGLDVAPEARPRTVVHDGGQPPDDLGVFDLIARISCPPSAGRDRWPSEPEPFLDWAMDHLAPGGQLVVAVPPAASEMWRDCLEQCFLRVESLHLRGDVTDLRVEAGETASSEAMSTDAVAGVLIASAALRHLPPGPRRLHVGAGSQRLEGWINVDIRPFPGVDLVADVTRGLELTGIDDVFAEHFLEHLAVDDALDFLGKVQRMLRAGGRLRLSTPNLDWVWRTHYRLEASPEDKVTAAVALNRAFHGWEHKFIWNRETLELALSVIGFRDFAWRRHGESDVEYLRGLERHETYDDDDDLRHVLIVEAVKGTPDAQGLEALRERLQRDFLDHVAGY